MSELTLEKLSEIVGYQLSDEQTEAVTSDLNEPLRVVAGAGSGKTSVMAARVVWAVGTGFVRPDEVLGLTFTAKAAGELSARVSKLLGRLTGGGDDVAEPVITTYHSFANQLVSEHGLRIGVEPGSRLLADNETAHLAYDVLRNTRQPLSGMTSGPAGLVPAVIALDQQLAEHVATTDQLRAHDRRIIERVEALVRPTAKDREVAATAARRLQLSVIVDELRETKLAADVIDFADLLRFGVELAEIGAVAAASRERWRLVLLDEYQDTSVVQTRLLAGLFGAGHSVTAVGDPLQGIYGWRGASAESMDGFSSAFSRTDGLPPRTCQLSISHRSGPQVLDTANRIAEPLRNEHSEVVTLAPAAGENGFPKRDGLQCALLLTREDEVSWISDRVADQVQAGADPSEIAVLCRATADFTAIASALAARGVASAVSAVEGLLEQPEVAEIISALQVLHDPTANPAALRILTGPRWRIGARDLAILGRRASSLARSVPIRTDDGQSRLDQQLAQAMAGTDPVDIVSLMEAAADPGSPEAFPFSPEARVRFAELTAELSKLGNGLDRPLPDVVWSVVDALGIDVEAAVAARRSASGVDRAQSVLSAFMGVVNQFASTGAERSLGGFLAWVSAVETFGGSPSVELTPPPGAVTILTVHKAKGLEWDIVAVPFLARSVFPTARSRSRWTTAQSELPHALRGDNAALPDLRDFGTKGHQAFADQMKAHSEAEERRLAYVAVTRPAKLLIASGHWWGPVQKTERGPSPYLEAVRESMVEFGSEPDVWEPEPTEMQNPFLTEELHRPWPAEDDPGDAAQLREAAQLVADAPHVEAAEVPSNYAGLVAEWDADLRMLLEERSASRTTSPADLPEALSATDLVALAHDPAGFAESARRPMPQRPSAAARRGVRFHDWVEQRFGVRPLFDELPDEQETELFTDDELAALQQAFLTTDFADRQPYAVETPFSIVLDGRVVKGRIDAVYRRGDRWAVIDWKTGADTDTDRADPLQLAIYRLAWSQIISEPLSSIDAAFVFVGGGRTTGEVRWHENLPTSESLEIDVRAKRAVVADAQSQGF